MPKKEKKTVEGVKEKEDKEFRHRVRVAGVILDGGKEVSQALTNIRGIGLRLSRIITSKLSIPKGAKLGSLTEKEIEKTEETISNMHKITQPWMLNRHRDYYSGESVHLIGPDLEMSQREDITKQKRIKSYRGIRHALGQPVRGQRTRSTFRTGATVGVVRKKAQVTPQKKTGG